MEAVTDKPNLVNGSPPYGTLADGLGSVVEQELTRSRQVHAGRSMVPTGQLKRSKARHSTSPRQAIGKNLKAAGGDPIGYDHNWVVNGDAHAMRPWPS